LSGKPSKSHIHTLSKDIATRLSSLLVSKLASKSLCCHVGFSPLILLLQPTSWIDIAQPEDTRFTVSACFGRRSEPRLAVLLTLISALHGASSILSHCLRSIWVRISLPDCPFSSEKSDCYILCIIYLPDQTIHSVCQDNSVTSLSKIIPNLSFSSSSFVYLGTCLAMLISCT
jgi:hypothetical protein